MSSTGFSRVAQAAAISAVAVPCVLLAHLLTTGAPAGPGATALVTAGVLIVATAGPACTTAGLALLTGLTQLVGHGLLSVASLGSPGGLPGAGAERPVGCLAAVGRGARIGLRLALLREDGGCPTGELRLGPAGAAAVTAVLVAVAILCGHVLAAALTGLLLARAATVARLLGGLQRQVATGAATLAALVATLVAQLRLTRAPVVPQPSPTRRPSLAAWAARTLRQQWHPAAAQRRGPPGAVGAPA